MNTIALRFGEHFAPVGGTISAHQEIIDEYGYVWYGKLGSKIGKSTIEEILDNEDPFIILIQSGKSKRYFAHILDIKEKVPEKEKVPAYYRKNADNFSTWFKISCFEEAPKDILSHCYILSSGRVLGEVSKKSMSPFFVIKYVEEEE